VTESSDTFEELWLVRLSCWWLAMRLPTQPALVGLIAMPEMNLK
jgi:hypothetical protein